MNTSQDSNFIWKSPLWFWVIFSLLGLALGVASYDGLKAMVKYWEIREEYSHGYIIPFIAIFLVWQKKNIIENLAFKGAWLGCVLVCIGLVTIFLGNLSTIPTITQYGFLAVVIGMVLSYMGWKSIKPILIPLLFLAFMIPLPAFFLNNLSSELQLISSEIGVAVIRLFDISVYLEGNVIDLGSYKLQVVEACSGLNYLFPLMSLAFMAAYFYQAAIWKRAVIFLSSIPVTIFMNSFRIGVIGVLVEHWGPSQAEGFLHDFEGWVIFMACTAILIAEMWVLTKLSKDNRPLRDVFGMEFPEPTPKDTEVRYRSLNNKPFMISSVLLLIMTVLISSFAQRSEVIPERSEFSGFPLNIDEWKGRLSSIEQIYLDALKLDDYIIANYANDVGDQVNFYVAYYASQRAGESAHSPRSCIPGGGWRINNLSKITVSDITVNGKPLQVNRLVIKKGGYKQLVYYWFQQRGRIITNEYLVKFYLFRDALMKNRSDGALVRLTTLVKPGEDVSVAEKKLLTFSRLAVPLLDKYIPE